MASVGEPPPGTQRPDVRVRILAERIGARTVASWCADLITQQVSFDDPGCPSLAWLGGAATPAVAERLADGDWEEWPRIWGARGLLHCWPDPPAVAVVDAIVAGLGDAAWRVREMAAKVVARHEVGAAADVVARAASDPVPRVRAAAVRALGVVGESEHIRDVIDTRHDDDIAVRRAAERAVDQLERRLDRTL